jgi:hypothetical protein
LTVLSLCPQTVAGLKALASAAITAHNKYWIAKRNGL